MGVRSTIGSKGQVTIPKKLKQRYHLLEGEDVIIVPSDEGVLIKHPPSSLRSRLKGKLDLQGFDEEIKHIRGQWRL
jgi:AbrB family looped-hinge helix DNA binding protein